jgi:hypothetical protein
MPNLYADVPNATLQKLIAGIGLSIRQPDGTIRTAYKDRLGKACDAEVPAALQASLGKATEFKIEITVNPDGNSARAQVICKSPLGVYDLEGDVDLTVLATKLV